MDPSQLQCWSRDSTTERVDVQALIEILGAVTKGPRPDVLPLALKRRTLLPASRAGLIAAHLTANTPGWKEDLTQLNGAAPTSPDNGAQFISECARWLRDAARTNESVHCLPGLGPFEIHPATQIVTSNDDLAVLQDNPDGSDQPTALAVYAKDLNPDEHTWLTRMLLEGFVITAFNNSETNAERLALIAEAPALTGSKAFDAFTAAIAHYVATNASINVPEWTKEPERAGPDSPYFPANQHRARHHQLVKKATPDQFADRNVFINQADLPAVTAITRHQDPIVDEDL